MDRFMRKVERVPGIDCWLWIGATKLSGYGNFSFRGRTIGAHVAAYSIFRGNVPQGAVVCHRCDNPSCVNPDHLFIGSQSENMNDMRRKGRAAIVNFHGEKNPMYGRSHTDETKAKLRKAKAGRFVGSKHPRASITESDVLSIRAMRSGGMKVKDIAVAIGASFDTVANIVRGKTWSHV